MFREESISLPNTLAWSLLDAEHARLANAGEKRGAASPRPSGDWRNHRPVYRLQRAVAPDPLTDTTQMSERAPKDSPLANMIMGKEETARE